MTCIRCKELLNEALNLACRSEQFEQQNRRQANLDASIDGDAWEKSGRFDQYVENYNEHHPQAMIATKSLTMHLWVQDQYDKDLLAWTNTARAHLLQGCPTEAQTARNTKGKRP